MRTASILGTMPARTICRSVRSCDRYFQSETRSVKILNGQVPQSISALFSLEVKIRRVPPDTMKEIAPESFIVLLVTLTAACRILAALSRNRFASVPAGRGTWTVWAIVLQKFPFTSPLALSRQVFLWL